MGAGDRTLEISDLGSVMSERDSLDWDMANSLSMALILELIAVIAWFKAVRVSAMFCMNKGACVVLLSP